MLRVGMDHQGMFGLATVVNFEERSLMRYL
jgi:hypothetical protein